MNIFNSLIMPFISNEEAETERLRYFVNNSIQNIEDVIIGHARHNKKFRVLVDKLEMLKF